jgi:peptidoglycan/LPS O-acetylase OafA/YrhL
MPQFVAGYLGVLSLLTVTALTNEALIRKDRFPILDALRFVLAVWVAVGHLGVFPLFAGVDSQTTLGRTLIHGWSSIVWGPPAVIGFFVISGFCIHLPYRHGEKLVLSSYFVRRYIRILLPVCVFLLLCKLGGSSQPIFGRESILWKNLLWSLFCEEIYYAIYPFVRTAQVKFGWRGLLLVASSIAVGAAIALPNALDGSLVGTIEIAVILYPIWLLGCMLADQCDALAPVTSAFEIWSWRFFAWLASWACEMTHFKGKLSLGVTLVCFGVVAFFWIRKEIGYGKHKNPMPILAMAGLWSYSLYLVHAPAAGFYSKVRVPNLGYVVNWCVFYAVILGAAYLFYRCVEKPSHQLARMLSAKRSLLANRGNVVGAMTATRKSPQ